MYSGIGTVGGQRRRDFASAFVHQRADREILIKCLAGPEGDRGARGDTDALLFMRCYELGPVCWPRYGTVEGGSVRPDEPERPIVEDLDLDLPFVHDPMMEAAQSDQTGPRIWGDKIKALKIPVRIA